MSDQPPQTPPPGWYPEPGVKGTQRYWDGERWTDNRAPLQSQEDSGSTVLVVVSYLAALLLPIVGFVLGLVLLVRRQTMHGVAVVVLALAVGLAACAIIANNTGNELEEATRELERELRRP